MKKYIPMLGLLLAGNVQALETLGSATLIGYCQSEEPHQVEICTTYINGFLDGAFATDPRVAENIVSELREEEPFTERAMRTRLGLTLDRFGPSYYADFCIPAELPVATIRGDIQKAPEPTGATGVNARDYLYQLLQTRYPCQKP